MHSVLQCHWKKIGSKAEHTNRVQVWRYVHGLKTARNLQEVMWCWAAYLSWFILLFILKKREKKKPCWTIMSVLHSASTPQCKHREVRRLEWEIDLMVYCKVRRDECEPGMSWDWLSKVNSVEAETGRHPGETVRSTQSSRERRKSFRIRLRSTNSYKLVGCTDTDSLCRLPQCGMSQHWGLVHMNTLFSFVLKKKTINTALKKSLFTSNYSK